MEKKTLLALLTTLAVAFSADIAQAATGGEVQAAKTRSAKRPAVQSVKKTKAKKATKPRIGRAGGAGSAAAASSAKTLANEQRQFERLTQQANASAKETTRQNADLAKETGR